MNALAFVLLAGMLTVYVVLDGYDLGVGTVLYVLGRTRNERAEAMASIGPYWSGNEVWLIAAGGTLFALFPRAYAVSFSGFYLPLMIALWLLMGRGIALELRNHLDGELWHDFWDAIFALSSGLLAVVFGVALGNLLRGLPLDASGYFIGSFSLLLNPYALLVALLALLTLAHHGMTFLNLSVPGAAQRLGAMQRRLWWLVLIAYVGTTVATAFVHPLTGERLFAAAAALGLSLLALVGSAAFASRGKARLAFSASAAFVGLLVITASGTIFPYLVPAIGSTGGISVFDAGPSSANLAVIVAALGIGVAGAVVSTIVTVRRLN